MDLLVKTRLGNMNRYRKIENNKFMNQILVTKIKKDYKKFFKFQFIFSLIIVVILIGYYIYDYKQTEELDEISEILSKNIEISKMYNVENQVLEKSIYFGKIRIDKIDIEYPIFNDYKEELLRIAPCKFYGGDMGAVGNVCIAGHNYNDNRFFGRLDELKIKDEIKLIDLNEKEYVYIVFDIFETEDTNVESVIHKKKAHELTLLTCNNSNQKRIIIKAYLNQ